MKRTLFINGENTTGWTGAQWADFEASISPATSNRIYTAIDRATEEQEDAQVTIGGLDLEIYFG